jgi:hypothetical protein
MNAHAIYLPTIIKILIFKIKGKAMIESKATARKLLKFLDDNGLAERLTQKIGFISDGEKIKAHANSLKKSRDLIVITLENVPHNLGKIDDAVINILARELMPEMYGDIDLYEQ